MRRDSVPDSREPGRPPAASETAQAASRKWGAGSLAAAANLGLAELRQAASIEGSIAQPTPYGMFGNPTPGEIADERGIDAHAAAGQAAGHAASPGEIAEERGPYGPANAHSSLYGEQTQGNKPSTPGDIADDRTPIMPESDHSHERSLSRSR